MEKNFNSPIPVKEFFNSRVTPLTAVPTTVDTWFNGGYDTFIVEVSGTGSISAKVMGCVNICDPDGKRLPAADRPFTALKVINLKSFDVTDTISSAGIYAVGVQGIANVKVDIISLSGSFTVVGSCGDWGK